MRFEMKMPDLSTNDPTVRVVRWLVEAKQKIERGQPIMEVETDKATMEVESPVSGVLEEILCAADVEVPVGQPIAAFEVERK